MLLLLLEEEEEEEEELVLGLGCVWCELSSWRGHLWLDVCFVRLFKIYSTVATNNCFASSRFSGAFFFVFLSQRTEGIGIGMK